MGYVKISHDLKNWGWISEPKTAYVLFRLMLEAAWAESDYKGVHLTRGQAVISQREYAKDIGITYQELRTALDRLSATHKITRSSTHKYTIVTLLEYDCDTQSSTNASHAEQPTDDKQITQSQRSENAPSLLYKKDNNIIRPKNTRARESGGSDSDDPEFLFDSFWEAYPRKASKQEALTAWKQISPDIKLTQAIIAAVERHKRSSQWINDNGIFIPYPSTWLNRRLWEDECYCRESNADKTCRLT